jgi:hypothetical protein
MLCPLQLHPDSAGGAVDKLDVDLSRSADRRLSLRFAATGELKRLQLPPRSDRPARTDGLWKHTCFELFVGTAGDAGYYEFNLSPSRDWACYRFHGYREGMTPPREAKAPVIDNWMHFPTGSDGARGVDRDYAGTSRDFGKPFFDLTAVIDLSPFGDLTLDLPWRIGLSAVIEERNGNKSYWALAHPPGKPDFHHADCFALQLPAARPA